jgi:catechol 2,3-dioxygenase-like lactoylglutathione lyase family enzyme
MKLNHLHINVPDINKAFLFYAEFFNFKVVSKDDESAFLKDESGFLLALDLLNQGENSDPPGWFHFGFCLEHPQQVKELYYKMKLAGVEFARELKEFGDSAVNFYCRAPGNYKLEVSWNRDE